jgi:prephenate dehydrogenase
MHIAFIGLGLIGGSIARALRRMPAGERPTVAAYSPGREGRTGGAAMAAAEVVIDLAAPDAATAVAGADLVVLAMPASAVGEWLTRLAGEGGRETVLSPDATVTDVASTKTAILGQADALGLRFVGGHPMAGLERSGYEASTADLFADRPWVLVPGVAADAGDVARAEWLARACGARPIRMTATAHDAAAAAISHLPLVLSTALTEAVIGVGEGTDRDDWPAAADLAATGWQSMTRLARGDATMGAAILATNADQVAARIRDVQAALDGWLAELERADGPDEVALRARLEAARRRLARDGPSR